MEVIGSIFDIFSLSSYILRIPQSKFVSFSLSVLKFRVVLGGGGGDGCEYLSGKDGRGGRGGAEAAADAGAPRPPRIETAVEF